MTNKMQKRAFNSFYVLQRSYMYQEAQLTAQATSCLRQAYQLMQRKNQNSIRGDDLFAGIYFFVKESQYADIFFNLLGRKNHEILNEYFKKNNIQTQKISSQIPESKIQLKFNKNIHTQIQGFVNK